MSDLIERLRAVEHYDTRNIYRNTMLAHEAADEIERLKADVLHWKGMTKGRESEIDKHLAEIKRLRAALERMTENRDYWFNVADVGEVAAREALKDEL